MKQVSNPADEGKQGIASSPTKRRHVTLGGIVKTAGLTPAQFCELM
jgi:hypothetical protein